MSKRKRQGEGPRRRAKMRRGLGRAPRRTYRYGTGKELKFRDSDLDDATIAVAGTVTPSIVLIAQGVTESQRVGRKCTVANIGWKYNISLPLQQDAADIGNGDVVRVIMYLDKQANGATAAVTDILETADYQSFNNLSNVGRFTKLLDATHEINSLVAGTDGANTITTPEINNSYTFYKKCNIPLEFNSTAGVITEIRSNNIGVLLLSKNGNAGFDSKIRIRFEG